MWIKICGNTNLADAQLAATLGADAVGFVFAPSKRQVTAAEVARITPHLPAHIERVGVFPALSAEGIAQHAQQAGLTAVQLHGGVDLALLQQLHLGPADIVGHSDGGNVALLLARYHPDLVRRVVVSGANFRGDFAGLYAYVRLRWGTSEQHFAAGIPVTVRHDYDAVSPYGDRHWDVLVAKTKVLWTTWTVISPEDLRAIRTPVLIMAGDHDVISLEHTIALYRSLPAGRLCILPNTGHGTMTERPSLFNELTRTVLDEEGLR